jgi:putative sterol carrier protein
MSEPKFFSEEWCREALKLEEAHNPEMRKTLKNPDTFSHVLGFEVADRPGVIVHGQYVEGRPAVWTSENLFPDDQIWAAFRANLEHFQEAVSGKTPAASLVMGGKIRLVRGSMKDAIENAQPLNLLMRLWGTVPTDWDI